MPLFPEVDITLPGGDGSLKIVRDREGPERRISGIKCGGKTVRGYFVTHDQLAGCGTLTIKTK